MKPHKELEVWLNARIKHWASRLLLADYQINLRFDAKMDDEYLMQNSIDYPYKFTTLYYGPLAIETWKNKDKSQLDQGVLHELAHKIIDPIYCVGSQRFAGRDEMKNAMESATDHIANVIYKSERIQTS